MVEISESEISKWLFFGKLDIGISEFTPIKLMTYFGNILVKISDIYHINVVKISDRPGKDGEFIVGCHVVVIICV